MNSYLIKDLVQVNRGSSPRPIIEYLSDSGYRWLKISDFKMYDRYVYDTKEHIKESGLKNTRHLSAGTLILTNSATPGIPIFLGRDMCLHDGFLYFSNIKNDIIDINYLYYWFLYNRSSIVNQANGSVFQNLKKEIVENCEIEVPNIEIQKKAVNVLDNINKKIELNNEINNNLYELAINYLNEKVEETKVPVSKFAKIQGGYAFKSKDLIDTYTKNRIIKIKNLRSEINADVINSQFVENEVVEKLDNKFRLSKGDVAIAMTGAELGKTGFIYGNDNYYLNQRVGVIRGNNKASELYLNILFLSDEFQTLLNSKGYGSAQPNVSTSDIENILINDITEDNLKELYEIIKPIYEKIISNSEEILNLEQLRDTLLPKLMNGEIDLDNIKI